MQIDIGIPEAERQQIVEGLSRLLADTYTLYLKTHNFHWNVRGPMFSTLHQMFMRSRSAGVSPRAVSPASGSACSPDD